MEKVGRFVCPLISGGEIPVNYQKHYDNLIERARMREKPTGYVEEHHIIPRCMGGSDDESNLVALKPEEHFTAHLLLTKIYPGQSGLYMAARMMCMTSHGRKNKEYAWVRRKISESMSTTIRETWAMKYGFRNYVHQCEEVFKEFLVVKRKGMAGKRWGLSEANSIQSVNYWMKLTGQEKLVAHIVKEEKSKASKETAHRQWSKDNPDRLERRRKKSQSQNRKDRKLVSIDGVTYKSVMDAAKTLGNERGTIRRRCMNDNWPTWFYVDSTNDTVLS